MKRLPHAELAKLKGEKNWAVLWQHAIPLVKLVVGQMTRGGTLRREDVDDDLLQEGMLVAGRVMRTWDPVECAFSTHIKNWLRSDLLNYQQKKHNGGIGGKDRSPVILSLADQRDDAPQSEDGEPEDDGTFEAALSYEGVVLKGSQFDGLGAAPEGYGQPDEEAGRQNLEEAVREIVEAIKDPTERDAIVCIYGINGPAEHPNAYAERNDVTRMTVSRWLKRARQKLLQKLPNALS